MLKHCTVEKLEALCYELAVLFQNGCIQIKRGVENMALPLALSTEDGLTRDSAKANRARDLCKNWEVVLDSIENSLIVMDHLQMFVKNAGTNEDIHASDRVLVAHHYNCIN